MRWIASLLSLALPLAAQSSPQAPPTINQNTGPIALRDAHLPAQVKHDIVSIVGGRFQNIPGLPAGRTIALSSWVSQLQLALTGPPVIEIDGGPDDYNNGATGNGEIWLFRRVGNHAVLIFSGGGFNLKPESKTYHNGMLDLQTAWNMSCCSGGIEVYRFDGHQYKPAYCYDYETDEDDNIKFGPHKKCEN
jgi:hypothetical protein